MYDARTLSGWQHMRLAVNFGVAGLLIFLLAGCASPFGMGSGWAYNPVTNTCERAAFGLSKDECRRQVVSAATAFARSLPTNAPTDTATPTPRPPTATPTNTAIPTNTPLPTATQTSTPVPTPTATSTNTPVPTATTPPTATPQTSPTARLTITPSRGNRGTLFSVRFTGGQPNQRAQWVITHPTGYVERVSFGLDSSGNFRDLEYKVSATHPIGVYRNEAILQGKVVASATFEVTQG